jgi:membrane AbrB-like protein
MTAWVKGEPLTKASRQTQWGILLTVSATLVGLFNWAHLPAALMLGPMAAGILIGTGGADVRVPAGLYSFAQGVIGCLVARAITPQILSAFALHWALFLGIMLAVITASCALGWAVSRLGILPGTTAVWGLLPGAASVMMIMADSFGADGRLVAFIQYLRVVFVAVAAVAVARLWGHTSSSAASIIWFPAIHWTAFLETLALIVLSPLVARKFKISAGAILVPLVVGSLVNVTGLLKIELPQWFLAVSYALVGWNTGLRFTREILVHAARTLPQIILSVILIMAFCGGLAWVLVRTVGIDPLTAYLATSPGGVDSVAIIAASTRVDIPFVMSMQVARLMIIIMVGPSLARRVARLVMRNHK